MQWILESTDAVVVVNIDYTATSTNIALDFFQKHLGDIEYVAMFLNNTCHLLSNIKQYSGDKVIDVTSRLFLFPVIQLIQLGTYLKLLPWTFPNISTSSAIIK